MSLRIEDYALIGDLHTAALVGNNGSIDWMCIPRFDSPACFAALLGDENNGYWSLHPVDPVRKTHRRYRDNSLVLETSFETDEGAVTLIDFMPTGIDDDPVDVVRIVRGDRGRVPMRMEACFRFDYGTVVPWVTRCDGGLRAIAGPDRLRLRAPIDMHGEDMKSCAAFVVEAGDEVPFVLTWSPSHGPERIPGDPHDLMVATEQWWERWARSCTKASGPWHEAVMRSLITLKALTYAPTGGIVAAPTTSLPEEIGGVRNWDYRFCWVRDATFTLYAFLIGGYLEEAKAWREWLLRAVAGEPSKLQILYGLGGERRLPEMELPWLRGYADSQPVRVGNAAHSQRQLDTYGELMDVLHVVRREGIEASADVWAIQRGLLDFLESNWMLPDSGLWEVRGDPRHFTHSNMMCWVAFDRAVKAVERFGEEGPVDRWRRIRDTIHADVCRHGWDADRKTFVQYYGGDTLDAALLMMPLVGFLPVSDERVVGTVAAIERELMVDGVVLRYGPEQTGVDGIRGGEGAFLACSFWLADNWAMMGRREQATELFEKLLAVRNDVGLLAEEYDPEEKRLLGNFPQAFSHVALINTAYNLSPERHPSGERGV